MLFNFHTYLLDNFINKKDEMELNVFIKEVSECCKYVRDHISELSAEYLFDKAFSHVFDIVSNEKNIHGFCLGLFSDVNVWLHGFVIAVAGPLHHYLWSDTVGEGEADEGSSGGMGADKFVFRICFLNSFACPVEYLGNRFVKFT